MFELNQTTTLYAPSLTPVVRDGWTVFVDADAPNWVSVDARGGWLLRELMRRPASFAALVSSYCATFAMDSGKAWVHVQAFVSEALRHRILSLTPIERKPYLGRSHYLTL